jgi:hypothetical protein
MTAVRIAAICASEAICVVRFGDAACGREEDRG